jgi:hypothetical protein
MPEEKWGFGNRVFYNAPCCQANNVFRFFKLSKTGTISILPSCILRGY